MKMFNCIDKLCNLIKYDTSEVVRTQARSSLEDFKEISSGIDLLKINSVLKR